MDFVIVRDAKIAATVDVKRLPKRPSPPRFGGRKLSAAQKERATHVCVDCGYVYTLPTPFGEQGKDYKCPQCNVGKNRFKVVEQAGSAYSNLAAQKKANKAAAAKAKKGKGPSPRELARQKMIEAQEEADAKKGRGFFGR